MDDRNGSSRLRSIKLGEGKYEVRTRELSLQGPKIYHYSISFLLKREYVQPDAPIYRANIIDSI